MRTYGEGRGCRRTRLRRLAGMGVRRVSEDDQGRTCRIPRSETVVFGLGWVSSVLPAEPCPLSMVQLSTGERRTPSSTVRVFARVATSANMSTDRLGRRSRRFQATGMHILHFRVGGCGAGGRGLSMAHGCRRPSRPQTRACGRFSDILPAEYISFTLGRESLLGGARL